MKPSGTNKIVGGFISWNQYILPMKFLDMPKRVFAFSGEKIKVFQVPNTFINDLENV